jgi:superfamily I DNA/RNA helicase
MAREVLFGGVFKFPNCKGTRDAIQHVESNKEIKLAKGSPEQEAIWQWLETGTENGIIEALAGVGKTYTIVNAVMRLRGVKIGVFSFNNHIIREMNEKLQKEGITWARGYTYNAFGFRAIKNSPQLQNAELFQDKLPTIITELLPEDNEESLIIRNATAKLVRLCKCYMEDGKNQDVLSDLTERFNVEINGDCGDYEEVEKRTKRIFDLVPQALDLCLKRKTTLDFDDQVWWTVNMKLPVEKFDLVFIDESQDTNKMQQKLVEMACT